MKKFLFISYYFPPAGGPSVQRILRIIQHLANAGWQCVILTVQDGDYTSLDPDLSRRIPASTRVIRTHFFEPYRWYRKFIGKKPDEKIPLAVLSSHAKASWKERFANTIRANLFIPDGRIGWYWNGVKQGLKAIQQHPDIEIILTSGPPHTVHLIGATLARKTELPFVADFRDPWVNIDYYSDMRRNPLTVAFDRWLEGRVLARADAVTVVGPSCRDQILAGHPNISSKKTEIIYNGYDPDVYPPKKTAPPRDRFILTYIGNLPFNRFIPAFYQALAELRSEKKIQKNKFQLHFYGRIDEAVKREIAKFEINDLLFFHDFVPHEQAIRATIESHLLLLIINDTLTKNGIVPGKMFEYLATERLVMAIGPVTGDAAQIYQQTGSGIFFDYHDVPGMKNFLQQQVENWERGDWKPIRSKEIKKYQRSEQLKKLEKIFNRLVQ